MRAQELGFKSYRGYLASEHWQDVRYGMKSRFGSSCEHCGFDDRLHIHHFNYDRLGDERINDLAVLCWSCHADAHEFPEHGDRIRALVSRRRAAYVAAEETDLELAYGLEQEVMHPW